LKYRLITFIAIIFAYLGWGVYQQKGWTLIVTLEVIWLICSVMGTYTMFFIERRLSHKYDPAFILAIIFIVSIFTNSALGLSMIIPSSHQFDLQNWTSSPLLVLLGWFNWPLGITALALACSKPTKRPNTNK